MTDYKNNCPYHQFLYLSTFCFFNSKNRITRHSDQFACYRFEAMNSFWLKKGILAGKVLISINFWQIDQKKYRLHSDKFQKINRLIVFASKLKIIFHNI